MAKKHNHQDHPKKSKRSGGIGRRESLAIGIGALAAITDAITGPAAAQGSAAELGGGQGLRVKGASRGVGTSGFRHAVERALGDPSYALQLKNLAIEARQGSKTAADQLMNAFALTPVQIKAMNAGYNTKPMAFLTSIPCIATLTALTLLFSCAPRDWKICSEAEGSGG
jgi:hypothetical protein